MRSTYRKILLKREANRKMIAVLLDPDKCSGRVLAATISVLKTSVPDFIFVGGSHTLTSSDLFIDLLREETKTTIVQFPGNAAQFSTKADAILYLSLLNVLSFSKKASFFCFSSSNIWILVFKLWDRWLLVESKAITLSLSNKARFKTMVSRSCSKVKIS